MKERFEISLLNQEYYYRYNDYIAITLIAEGEIYGIRRFI